MADEVKKTDAKKEPKAPRLEKGASVNLVHANGSHLPAFVSQVHKDGKVDLVTVDGAVTIHGSPNDPTGKIPDSWHFPLAEDGAE